MNIMRTRLGVAIRGIVTVALLLLLSSACGSCARWGRRGASQPKAVPLEVVVTLRCSGRSSPLQSTKVYLYPIDPANPPKEGTAAERSVVQETDAGGVAKFSWDGRAGLWMIDLVPFDYTRVLSRTQLPVTASPFPVDLECY